MSASALVDVLAASSRKVHGPNSERYAETLLLAGDLLMNIDRKLALRHLTQALGVFDATVGRRDLRALRTAKLIADGLATRSTFEVIARQYLRILATIIQEHGPNVRFISEVLESLSALLAMHGRAQEVRSVG